MAGFRITITDSVGNVVQAMESALEGVKDFRPLWARLRVPWEKSRRLMFGTNGASTGVRWPLPSQTQERERYVYIKARILKSSVERMDDIVLQWDPESAQRLRPSLINTRNPAAVWRPGKTELVMGTSIPYADKHDQGLGRAPGWAGRFGVGYPIPRRPLLRFGIDFERDTVQALGDFAADIGGARTGLTSAQVRARLGGP